MEDGVITDYPSQVGFRVYTQEEILKLSVKELINPQLFDHLNVPTIGGLYDSALGSTRNDEECSTCGQSGRFCPGHMGHINLALPVFNPVFFKTLFKLLQGVCLQCHRLFMPAVEGQLLSCQLSLLERGCVVGARSLQDHVWQFMAEKGEQADMFVPDLCAQLKKMTKRLLKDPESSFASPASIKMADAEITVVVESAMKRFFTKPRKCPHCHTSALTLRHEYFSRISARGTLSKAPRFQSSTPKRQITEGDVEMTDISEDLEDVNTLLQKGKGQCVILPHLARQILRRVWDRDGEVLGKVFRCLGSISDTKHPTDMFFLTAVLVSPSRYRPLSVMGDLKFENQQTANFSRVMADNFEIRQLLANMNVDLNTTKDLTNLDAANTSMEEVQKLWIQLQVHINCLMDSDLDKLSAEGKKLQGIRQVLEKKEGLFRMHMMGKRVNFAARSVISPDPCINTNEIGVPLVFARKLTYPQPVTPWNVHELRQNVINGPDTYPGASAVVNGDGSVIKLSLKSRTQREAVAKQLLTPSNTAEKNQLPKQVLRHVKNGDVLLLNRQPTLHRPSIQAHKARVLTGLKTLRLHYSNCKAYNADFDGDEMNAHFPQSELCRAEAYGIASTDFQYLVPKDGSPLAGLIQDHLVAGVSLSIRGRFFSRGDYCNLLQSALTMKRGRLRTLRPCILKPCQQWSGKQVISTLIMNIIPADKPPLSFESKSKIDEKSWISRYKDNPASYMTLAEAQKETEELGESTVVMEQGELLQGVLDKNQCGPASYGLVHCVYELYGGEVAGQLLTCLGRLFTSFLKLKGFTVGMEDILTKPQAESRRAQFFKESSVVGVKAAREAFDQAEDSDDLDLHRLLREAHFGKDDMMKHLDMCAKTAANAVVERSSVTNIKKDLFKNFPDNNLQLMEQSGAKGASANTIQMASMLGQIELEGRRPPLMISGRSLPSFQAYDLSLRAGGFVTRRFLTSIPSQEFSFHCMAGREGLIDTAVKTSRSGYLQRCLVKHLEGLTVKYDMTVRDSDASVVQFFYGEDGLEVCKTRFLEEKQLPFLLKNQQVIGVNDDHAKGDKAVRKHRKKVDKWQRKHAGRDRGSGFLDFCSARQRDNRHLVNGGTKNGEIPGKSARKAALEVEWRGLSPKERHKFVKRHKPCPDPVMSSYWPQRYNGSISEKLQQSVNTIQQQLIEVGKTSGDKGRQQRSVAESETLAKLVNHKAMRALCDPGESVGLLCAQSIGEPSTQMTLNTFHFAGRGEMNVTLGIPRLREVLMTASANILTPCMEIPILDSPEAQACAKRLQKKLNCVFLSDVLEEVTVRVCVKASSSGLGKKRFYSVRFSLLPKKTYKSKINIAPADICESIENVLISRIVKSARKYMDKHIRLSDLVTQSASNQTEKSPEMETETVPEPADNGDSDNDILDDDSTAVKALARHSDTQEYEGEEEEKEEVGDATQQIDEDDDGREKEENAAASQADDMEVDPEGDNAMDEEMAEIAQIVDNVEKLAYVHKYRRDKKGKWCELVLEFDAHKQLIDVKSVVEKEARRLVLQQVKGIKRCLLAQRSNDSKTGRRGMHLVTEGVNLQEMMKYSNVFDVNALYTNSIADIQNIYGIEAANKAIIKEVQQVFNVYGIKVDNRHLSLLADYMTCEGCYKGFNRSAISSNPSPLQKITFETSMTFLVNACRSNRPDELKSPSARIVAGQVMSCGTGAFEVIEPLSV